jgi:hypothetical protein
MINLKTLGKTLLDIAYSRLEKELENDFLLAAGQFSEFLTYNDANSYIKECASEVMDPEMFVQEYQKRVTDFLCHQVKQCQKIMLQKKYLVFIAKDSEKFYSLYHEKYVGLFEVIDASLSAEATTVYHKAIGAQEEQQNMEMH